MRGSERSRRLRAVAGAVGAGLALAVALLFVAAGQVVGLPLALAAFVGLVLALRASRPRVRRRGAAPPIDAPPRDALESVEWPASACPRCGFMDLRWGGPMRLAAQCVRCGFAGAPGVYRSPEEFLEHLEALREAWGAGDRRG